MQRRAFLNGLIGCSVAASPLMTPISLAAAPTDNRLVVIILRGAMDGLDVVRPVGDPAYRALRPDLASAGTPIDLDGYFALHPALNRLEPLWRAGELSFAHAVSTPYRDGRSHFDGQDLLEAGGTRLDGGVRDGWLNRLLQVTPGTTQETAYSVGQNEMMVLRGQSPFSRWSPEVRLRISEATESLLRVVQEGDPLVAAASAQAIRIATSVEAAEARMADMAETDPDLMAMQTEMEALPNNFGVAVAQFAAQRLREETRIASFSINGWDTHARQARALPRTLKDLSDAILALRAGLGPDWSRTAVLCMTEFGRTAAQNGTGGTDHGTGGAMIFAGGALARSQVVTDWPGLAEADLYARRDLMPTRDVRAHAAWAMARLFGTSRTDLEGTVFPGLEMGSDPGLFG